MVLRAGFHGTVVGQSSAQVIDGSLRFDKSNSQYLKRTPGSAGNRSYYTGSAWVKRTAFAPDNTSNSNAYNYTIFSAGTNSANNIDLIRYYKNAGGDDNRITYESYPGSFQYNVITNAKYRDSAGWYHVIWNYNGTRSEIYVNGEHVTSLDTNTQNGGSGGHFNNNVSHVIGHSPDQQYNMEFDGFMSQFYWIDGLALGPGYFGFTDPLTNTWRPKKFIAEGTTVNDGTTWSSGIPGNTLSGYPATNAFNGNVSSFVYANVNTTMTWTAPKRITGQKIEVYVYAGNTHPIVLVNGKSTGAVVGGAAQQGVWVDVTDLCGGPGGVLETITAYGQNIGGVDRQSGFSAVAVDGVILIDSTTQNLDFGTNGFYLPMDGNSPIGQDKSGKGNNWTPVRFGNTNKIDSPDLTGGTPILNTNEAGTVALPGYKTDPNASNLVVALPMVGAEGGTSFNDIAYLIKGSGSSKSFTAFTGNSDGGGKTSTRGSVLYGSSFYTTRGATNANAGDYIERTGDSDLSMGTGDYCIEFWYHPYEYTTNDVLIDTRHPTTDWPNDDNGIMIYVNANGDVAMVSNGVQISGSGVVGKNQDNHFALTREGTTERLFVNGNLIGTATNRTNDYNRDRLHLGSSAPNGEGSSGYYNDLRVYKGFAKYTSPFKVGSPNPTVLPDTPSGVSGGSKLTKITDGAVHFDGTNDNLTIPAHSDLDLSSGNFTVEGFVYPQRSQEQSFVNNWNNGGQFQVQMSSSGTLQASWAPYSTGVYAVTGTTLIRLNAWSHFAYTRSGNTFELFLDGISQGTRTSSANASSNSNIVLGENGTNADRDFKGFLSNVRIIKGTALYTSNFTPPTAPLTNVTNTKLLTCQTATTYQIATVAPLVSGVNNGTVWSSSLTADSLFRSSSYPAKDAFNGVTKTSTEDCAATPQVAGQGFTFTFGGGVPFTTLQMQCDHNNGATVTANGVNITSQLSSGSLTNTTITGVTSPLTSLSVVSHNGDAGYLGSVTIDGTMLVDPLVPNGDAATTNFNPFTTDINTLRGQETGYATWNPLKMGTSDVSMSEGNLFWRTTSNGPDRCTYSTIGMDSGKFYWENEIVEATATAVGIANGLANDNGGPALAHNWMYYSATGQVYLDGSASSYGAAYNTNGTIIGVAFDRDNLTLEFYKNGVSQGKLTSISGLTDSETYFAMCGDSGGASQSQVRVNFGQKPFKFPPPDGFQPLNADNVLPETVISRPDQYVGVTTYLGSSGNVVVDDLNHKPDAVIIKQDNAGGGTNDWVMVDSVRGRAKSLYPSANYSQNTSAADKDLISFDRSGFTVGQTNQSAVNRGSSYTYLAFAWKAGGGTGAGGEFWIDDVQYASAAAAGLTGGDITPTGASVGTKQGFSIVTWDTASLSGTKSISTGLTQAPEFVITKVLDQADDWLTFHKDLSSTETLILNGDRDKLSNAAYAHTFNSDGTISGLPVGGSNWWISNRSYVFYSWHSVPGLQKFGSFKSNANADGPYVELGFRPAFVWVKVVDAADNWAVSDQARAPFNPSDKHIRLNAPDAAVNDSGNYKIDYLSNGFKIRGTNGEYNANAGNDYVYMAWAEAPAFNLYGGQSNAR